MGDSPHLSIIGRLAQPYQLCEQARSVKTVKVHPRIAKSYVDQTVGGSHSWGWCTNRYRLGHRSVISLTLRWLNVQSGQCKLFPSGVSTAFSHPVDWKLTPGKLKAKLLKSGLGKGIQLRLHWTERVYLLICFINYIQKICNLLITYVFIWLHTEDM